MSIFKNKNFLVIFKFFLASLIAFLTAFVYEMLGMVLIIGAQKIQGVDNLADFFSTIIILSASYSLLLIIVPVLDRKAKSIWIYVIIQVFLTPLLHVTIFLICNKILIYFELTKSMNSASGLLLVLIWCICYLELIIAMIVSSIIIIISKIVYRKCNNTAR